MPIKIQVVQGFNVKKWGGYGGGDDGCGYGDKFANVKPNVIK